MIHSKTDDPSNMDTKATDVVEPVGALEESRAPTQDVMIDERMHTSVSAEYGPRRIGTNMARRTMKGSSKVVQEKSKGLDIEDLGKGLSPCSPKKTVPSRRIVGAMVTCKDCALKDSCDVSLEAQKDLPKSTGSRQPAENESAQHIGIEGSSISAASGDSGPSNGL